MLTKNFLEHQKPSATLKLSYAPSQSADTSARTITMADHIIGILMIIAVLLVSIYTIYLSILMKHKIDRRERAHER